MLCLHAEILYKHLDIHLQDLLTLSYLRLWREVGLLWKVLWQMCLSIFEYTETAIFVLQVKSQTIATVIQQFNKLLSTFLENKYVFMFHLRLQATHCNDPLMANQCV